MEKQPGNESFKGGSPKHLPTYFECMTSEGVDGFNTNSIPRAELMGSNTPSRLHPASESHARSHSILMSLPSSPSALDIEQSKGVMLKPEPDISNEQLQHKEGTNDFSPLTRRKAQFHSQSLDICFSSVEDKLPKNQRLENKRYNSFKTWSGKLESQLSTLSGRQPDPVMVSGPQDRAEALPEVERYFDALEGPELETLRASEELVLPEDKKWPFLLRFPISSFGMCLGVSSQAILWKNLATTPSMSFLNVNPVVNLVLWCTALALMGLVASIYAFKVIFFFEAVRREYYHPVRVNFFFAPWIACLFLAVGVPPHVSKNLHAASWYVLMAPILCLELKIYGQWMSGGQRRLSKVANPSNHLSIVGNFVGALLGASMGLKEGPVFFFAVGLAHYTVLFVTLYQRLPTNETLPKELHPVFFLFIAAPSVACMAWANITGSFDLGSRIAYFTALFLYASLAVRINFFRGFRFSLAWWAYTFPMTGAAIATIRYTVEVNNVLTRTLAVGLSTISAVTVSALLISTILHAFVFHNLFPNDIAIAITHKRPKSSKKHSQTRTACVSQDD